MTGNFRRGNDHSECCHGESYSDPYVTFKNVYVAGWVEIKLQNSYQPVQIDANRIRLNSGVSCVFSGAHCIDEDGGHVFWDLMPEDACGINKYTRLYEGNMDKIYEPDEGRTMYSLETEDITFALWKKGEHKICGSIVARTEHPKLFILRNDRKNGFLNRNLAITDNLDIFTYVNSKFLYVEKYVRKQISQMYYDILRHKC